MAERLMLQRAATTMAQANDAASRARYGQAYFSVRRKFRIGPPARPRRASAGAGGYTHAPGTGARRVGAGQTRCGAVRVAGRRSDGVHWLQEREGPRPKSIESNSRIYVRPTPAADRDASRCPD